MLPQEETEPRDLQDSADYMGKEDGSRQKDLEDSAELLGKDGSRQKDLQDSVDLSEKEDGSSNLSTRHRYYGALCVAAVLVVVILLVASHKKNPERSPEHLQQQGIDNATYTDVPDSPLLVRCSWGASSASSANIANSSNRTNSTRRNAEGEKHHEQQHNMPFAVRACPREVCAHENSHDAYGSFLFHQAVAAERKSSNNAQYNATLHRFVHDPVQCLFLTTNLNEMCHCQYNTFVDFCHRTHYNNEVAVHVIGDSTAQRFQTSITSVCRDSVAPPAQAKRSRAVTKVVVYNDKTLHRLYLPFSRETDVPSKYGGYDQWLDKGPTSIPDFWRAFDERLKEQVDTHGEDNFFVYMANNEVCHDAYTDKYKKSEEFLLQNPDPAIMRNVQNRRGGNAVVNWGLTLDYYGSHLARKLSRARLKQHWPQFVYFPLDALYPAACVLTTPGDGRHFSKPGYNQDSISFYTIKARILWHLIESHVPLESLTSM